MRALPALLALSALTLTLAACATNTRPAAAVVEAGSPAPIPDFDWHLVQDAHMGTLAYGVADSDEVKLQLHCQAGSGALELAAMLEKPSREIHLESGGDTERYPAESEAAGINEGEYAQAAARTKDPVFQRFRRLGWIAVLEGDDRHPYAAHPASKPDIERFFAACG